MPWYGLGVVSIHILIALKGEVNHFVACHFSEQLSLTSVRMAD
jgi:hypothetical protein